MKVVNLKCPQCNAILEINDNSNYAICKYCGTKVSIENENETKVERMLRKYNNYINSEHYKEKMKIKEEENKKAAKLSIIVCFTFILLTIILVKFVKNNPTLSQYNSLNLGMSYSECREILNKDGHLIYEENGNTTYVWYDAKCDTSETCPIIIKLNFENDKLISRSENGLK